jgi:hypothetical protein
MILNSGGSKSAVSAPQKRDTSTSVNKTRRARPQVQVSPQRTVNSKPTARKDPTPDISAKKGGRKLNPQLQELLNRVNDIAPIQSYGEGTPKRRDSEIKIDESEKLILSLPRSRMVQASPSRSPYRDPHDDRVKRCIPPESRADVYNTMSRDHRINSNRQEITFKSDWNDRLHYYDDGNLIFYL